MAKILFVDLETTGFDRQWDYIIEVAAILYDESTQKQIGQFHEYIKPGKRLSQKITEITGITEFQLMNCRSEKEVLADFFEWVAMVDPDSLTAYNSPFDRGFLDNKREKYGLFQKEMEWFDMMKFGRQLKKEGKILNYKQTSVADYFNITYQAHRAIEDVKALIVIYEKLELNKNKKTIRASLGF